MDRQPEDPSPEDGVPDEPVSPYGPAEPAELPQSAQAAPTEPGGDPVDAEPPPPDGASPYGPPPKLPGEPPPPGVWPPANPSTERAPSNDGGPSVGAGVATGCGIQVLAVIAFFLSLGVIANFFGALWPFILITVGAAALMFSKRWRRFATGVLIVSAATWIIVIGPCIGLLSAGSWMG